MKFDLFRELTLLLKAIQKTDNSDKFFIFIKNIEPPSERNFCQAGDNKRKFDKLKPHRFIEHIEKSVIINYVSYEPMW